MSLFILCLTAVGSVGGAMGQDAAKLDVRYGFQRDYAAGKSTTYLNVIAFGQTLFNQGTASTFSDLSVGGLADPKGRPLYLSVHRGNGEAGGSLLQGYSARPLRQFLGGLRDFNLVLGVDAQLDQLERTTYSAQVEYKPIYPLHFIQHVLAPKALPYGTEYLVFGAGGQRQEDENGKTHDQGSLTARGMYALPFYFKQGDAQTKTARSLSTSFPTEYLSVAGVETARTDLRADPNLTSYGNNAERVKMIVSKYTARLVELNPTASTAEIWALQLTQEQWDEARTHAFIPGGGGPDSPNLTLWVDGNARYALSDRLEGDRFRTVWSANAKLILNTAKPDSAYLQVQYLNGFLEATPASRSNVFIVSIGGRF